MSQSELNVSNDENKSAMPCNDFIAYAACLKAQCLTGAVRSYGQYMYDACAQNGLWFILTTVLPVLEPKPLLWCTLLLLPALHTTTPCLAHSGGFGAAACGPDRRVGARRQGGPQAPTRFTVPSMQLGPDTLNISPASILILDIPGRTRRTNSRSNSSP